MRRARRALEMTQRALGETVCLDASAINKIEQGRRHVSLVEAVCIANGLGLTLNEMIDVPWWREVAPVRFVDDQSESAFDYLCERLKDPAFSEAFDSLSTIRRLRSKSTTAQHRAV